jgi:hypothetical protein
MNVKREHVWEGNDSASLRENNFLTRSREMIDNRLRDEENTRIYEAS